MTIRDEAAERLVPVIDAINSLCDEGEEARKHGYQRNLLRLSTPSKNRTTVGLIKQGTLSASS